MIHFLSAHWPLLACLAVVVALCACFPAVALACLRWVIGTQEGRIAALVLASIITFHAYGEFRYQAGYSAAVAKRAASDARAQTHAAQAVTRRDQSAEAIGDQSQAKTAAHINTGQTATHAAQERTHARIESNPAVAGCAGPDPGVMQDVHASDQRLRAAADRMRRIGAGAAN